MPNHNHYKNKALLANIAWEEVAKIGAGLAWIKKRGFFALYCTYEICAFERFHVLKPNACKKLLGIFLCIMF